MKNIFFYFTLIGLVYSQSTGMFAESLTENIMDASKDVESASWLKGHKITEIIDKMDGIYKKIISRKKSSFLVVIFVNFLIEIWKTSEVSI